MSEAVSLSGSQTAPAWAASLVARRLVPLAQGPDPAATVWGIEADRIAGQISEQFTANDGEYHARYANAAHFQGLFEQAIRQLDLKIPDAPLIFDMGSGSGVNSIVPCFNLFPARVSWPATFPATSWSCWPTTPPSRAWRIGWSAW